ncbi:MAG: hypothetical protein DMD91_31630 [Candidatus Rokuibacteriota bacterium]|nr:MAG: hypothetical protein DMD91_31630 [Candidatus Rokubacteria bacterium]
MNATSIALTSVLRRAWDALQPRRGAALEMWMATKRRPAEDRREIERMLRAREAQWRLRC